MMLRRFIVALSTSAVFCLVAGGAWAGGYVRLGCGDWQEEFMVGTGQQFRGQGLELWPMLCLSSNKISSYARVMNADHFARLQTLAAQKAPDSARLADWMTTHDDLALQIGVADMFAEIGELTFGDIRSTVTNAARPTEETILTTSSVYYIHPTCAGRLIPFDYYLDRPVPCPACQGGRLKVIEGGNHAEWD
ncbi:hypothetical protein [Telmatospirillum sp.]|uniref:hypothetical protein n=1 Tax=Telmatospirillum sp. TaxID=2079197 RepID=UPI002840E2F0|nr:hypothetical protein [Telmatospirillum sp.]MDR3437595.1 hypothetical protein [Telmatospirillum sp.]